MTCTKCGGEMNGPRYHAAWTACRSGDHSRPLGEHLHYYCTCGFDTTTRTNDARVEAHRGSAA